MMISKSYRWRRPMNSYESYKFSDIDWIEKIPSHWETVKPKYKLNRVTRSIDDDDEVVTCFRDGVVTLRKNRRMLLNPDSTPIGIGQTLTDTVSVRDPYEIIRSV